MESIGFINVRVARRRRIAEQNLRQFLAYARQRFRTSQLMVISDDDYDAGIQEIERDIDKAGDKEAGVKSEICIATITGDRPGRMADAPVCVNRSLDLDCVDG